MTGKHLWAQARQTWQAAWQQRTPREQVLLHVGALLLVLVVLWSTALAPAWRTWQEAPARQTQLDQQSQRMRQLQAQAQTLQKPPTVSRTEASQWLEKNLSELGPNAQIILQGDQVSLQVEAAPAQAMARWLSQARDSAQALPTQGQIQQRPNPDKSEVLWQGTLVLRLP